MLPAGDHRGHEIVDEKTIEAVFILPHLVARRRPRAGGARQFDKFLKLAGLPLVDRADEVGTASSQLARVAHDFTFDLEAKRWKKWTGEVPAYEPPTDGKFSSIMVPTSDTVRSTWLLDTVVTKAAIIFIGESGTAKTTIIQKYLSRATRRRSRARAEPSSRTSSKDVQIGLDTQEKREGHVRPAPSSSSTT